jgi:surface protein
MFNNCNKITELDLSKWNVDNVEDMTLIFICPILTKLNISTWTFNKITDFTNLFSSCDSLVNISVLNANIINQMAANMPDRIGGTSGTITIVGDKTNLDTSLLNSKNWNVV